MMQSDVDLSILDGALGWVHDHWLTMVLTGEIVGAVIAVKTGHYRKGIGWLGAAMLTIWVGAY